MTEPMNQSIPLACDLTAIDPQQRAAHQALGAQLLTEALERRDLPDGYALRFAPERYDAVAAFIANERRCCPFFTFVLTLTPQHGPLWLQITGPEGAQALLAQLRGS